VFSFFFTSGAAEFASMDKLQPVKLAKVSVKINIDNDLMVIRTVYILILPFYPFPHYFYSKL
jgi:hypothetical protein